MVQLGFAPLPAEPTTAVKFVSAGLAACIAEAVSFPLDTAKVRLQIQGEGGGSSVSQFRYRGVFGTIATISRTEGVRACYSGLVAGFHRQLCFASVRIGLYDKFKEFFQNVLRQGKVAAVDVSWNRGNADVQAPVPVGTRILAGVTAGFSSVLVGQPTDVVKVRMQAQGATGVVRYTGAMQAYVAIAKAEGRRGLWKGTLPNCARNAIINAAELVSYELFKDFFLRRVGMSDNLPCHFFAAFGAGFVATVFASPADVVKTRYMNSPPGKYRGVVHCIASMWRERGLVTFYKGFTPNFVRVGVWNVVLFVCYEQLKRGLTHATSFAGDERRATSLTSGRSS